VQIFFVLSGFVIAYSLRQEKISPRFCLRFFLKRSIRLDPPYWLIVALMLMLNFMGSVIFNKGGEFLATPFQVLMNLLYLPDFPHIPRILPVAWTLCIEIQFYMSFFLLLLVYQFFMNRF
jgi:peptidoglycan/LPS O-acetylase OafA/YrhL